MNYLIHLTLYINILSAQLLAAEDVSIPLQKFIQTTLVPFPQQTPPVMQAVLTQNEKNLSHEMILQRDQEWQNTTDLTPFMFSLMSNQCAYELLRFVNHYSFILEAFVMDNQGALVCLTHKTSDYWQGDEEKFIQSFAHGKGTIFSSEEEYDESVGELARQISVPIMNDNQAIGAITFTIGVDSWGLRE